MIPNHKGEIPVVLLFIPFVCGLLAGIIVFPHISLNFLVIVFSVLAAIFIVLNFTYQSLKIFKSRWLGGVLAACALFLFGWILPLGHNELQAKNHFSKSPAEFEVVEVNNEPT